MRYASGTPRILLIAYNFPPLISPQSLRWFYLVRELSEMGYGIDVLTVRMPGNFRDLVEELPPTASIHRTYPGPFYNLTYRSSREAAGRGATGRSQQPSPQWKLLSRVYSGVRRMLNDHLPIPDIYSEWLPFALRRGSRVLKEGRYDWLISSSEPRICHVVGYCLKKKSGIPWIADYGDPWVYPVPIDHESRWKRRSLQYIERKLLKEVEAVIVAADGIRKLYEEQYPFFDRTRIRVVTQGCDPGLFSGIRGETPSGFRIVYCGSFYRSLRDPTAFFEAVMEVDREDIEVVIAGRINEFEEMLASPALSGKVTYRGFLDHKESLALEKSGTVLLHIGNVSDTQVPGKIYEYFGAEKPILCIRGGERDLSAELVMRYNRGIAVPNDKEAIKRGIEGLYDLWRQGLLDKTFDSNVVEEFTWKRGAEKIADFLKTL